MRKQKSPMPDALELSTMGTARRWWGLLKASALTLVLAPVALFALSTVIQWWKEGHNDKAWHQVTGGAFAPELIAAGIVLLVLFVGQAVRAHLQVHAAHRTRAEEAEGREKALIAAREEAPVTSAHETQLRRLLEELKQDVSGGRACDYGDAGGAPDRRNSIAAHFDGLAVELGIWDAAAARLAKVPEELRTAIELCAAESGISDMESLTATTDRLTVLTRDRALAGKLGELVSLPISDRSESYPGRGLILLVSGVEALLVDGEPQDGFSERVEAAVAMLRELYINAQKSEAASAVTDAQTALMALGAPLMQSIERHLTSFPVHRRPSECRFCETHREVGASVGTNDRPTPVV